MSIKRLLEIKNRLPEVYQKRLTEELEVIIENKVEDFTSYFMMIQDTCNKAREFGMTIGPGRGSVGGSLVAYFLGITDLDPIKYNVPFSRFLSHARLAKSVPDIDLDFEVSEHNKQWHRNALNQYIFDKYGDRAAQVAAFSLMKLKAALLDSYRINVTQPTDFEIRHLKAASRITEAREVELKQEALKLEFDTIRKSLGTEPPGRTSIEWLDGYEEDGTPVPGLLEANPHFKKWTDKYPKILETARSMLGIPRQMSKHAAGIVISDVPIHQIAPVCKMDGYNVIALDKKEVAKLGLIKNDNLGLTALNFIGDTLRQLKAKGIVLDPWNLPEDKDVYTEFLDGRCNTIFQFETVGGAKFAQKLMPLCKEDLFAGVALNRPGALDAMITISEGVQLSAADVYLKRKAGELDIEYLHDDLKPILKDTYGIFCYQEQIMKCFVDLLGYSEEQSDVIRSAISDKDVKAFEKVKADMQVLLKKNWTQVQIDDLFQQILAFSRYSFNLAHSAEYGLISYTSAYLKHHYKLEWWTSVLSNSKPDDIIEKYWIEIGHLIDAPHINLSGDIYKIANGKIVPPLSLIEFVGEKAINDIQKNVPFNNFEDFLERSDSRIVNKRIVINLLKSGALDSLFEPPPATFEVDRLFEKNVTLSLSEKVKRYLLLKALREGKKKPEDMPEDLVNITPYDEYLLAKNVLPVCNKKLSEAVLATRTIKKDFITTSVVKNNRFVDSIKLRGKMPFVTGEELKNVIHEIKTLNDDHVEVCSYGYVIKARRFTYVSKTYQKEKEAIEVTIDFDNYLEKILCWPKQTEYSPEISKYLKEKTCYLVRLKVNQQDNFGRLNIRGLETINQTKLDKAS